MATRPLLFISIFFLSNLCHALNVDVDTSYGPIRGSEESDHFVWKGVPFAAPPVGQNRWRPPQPLEKWNQTLLTKEFAPGCPQVCLLPPRYCPKTTSESCLFLNVYAPKNATDAPVMFFIAGGAFSMGDVSSEIYNGQHLASSGSVVVLANYRLGSLGFLVRGDIEGNFGIRDQIAALQWVQQNIRWFGGNPDQVTIFGESAGGMSVGILLISSYSKGLFHRAIVQSNPLATTFKTRTVAEAWGSTFATALGCAFQDDDCLRSKTPEQLLSASKWVPSFPSHIGQNGTSISLSWDPVIDHDLVPDQVLVAMEKGRFHRVPIIVGTTSQEGWMFVNLVLSAPLPPIAYVPIVTANFGENALQVLKRYPPPLNPFADCRELFARLITDSVFLCPSRRFAELASSRVPTFYYLYSHANAVDKWASGNLTFCQGHVCHGAELPYVFGTSPVMTDKEKQLSKIMMSYWTTFAAKGDPNEDVKSWPDFKGEVRSGINFDTPPVAKTGLQSEVCDFWDREGYDVSR